MIGEKRAMLPLGGAEEAMTLAEIAGPRVNELAEFYRRERRYQRMLELMDRQLPEAREAVPEMRFQEVPANLPVSAGREAPVDRPGVWRRIQQQARELSGPTLTEAEEAYLKQQLLNK